MMPKGAHFSGRIMLKIKTTGADQSNLETTAL
jgi:hypothetical protein